MKRRRSQKPPRPKADAPDTERRLRSGGDRIVLQHADLICGSSALLILTRGTAVAERLIQTRPDLQWHVWTPEHFYLQALIRSLGPLTDGTVANCSIEVYCLPDLPELEFDTVLMPTDTMSTAELTQDLLQQACEVLVTGGRLIVSVNNRRDSWLRRAVTERFGKATVLETDDGAGYAARKKNDCGKKRDFEAKFPFRMGERLVWCSSRPGVFSHRRIDGGARALIRSLELLSPESDERRLRIAELGCGCGAAAVAAGLRYPLSEVLAADSHARAVASTEETARLNDCFNVRTMLSSAAELPEPGSWDLILTNPPYYSDYRISELFLESAVRALKQGGRIHLVTKLTDWHYNRMEELFGNVEQSTFGEYHVLRSRRP